ncbi:hypothetical protein J437_LFUL019388 [Ladona fulva]|uniref:Uncharacterized protein n=1 Tax=Ladona fulva TaxID=123851 RepID=A0A8K0KR73_LADFU|nr:hypothetical protein J437_LFUL019388 [Ladona fulva]
MSLPSEDSICDRSPTRLTTSSSSQHTTAGYFHPITYVQPSNATPPDSAINTPTEEDNMCEVGDDTNLFQLVHSKRKRVNTPPSVTPTPLTTHNRFDPISNALIEEPTKTSPKINIPSIKIKIPKDWLNVANNIKKTCTFPPACHMIGSDTTRRISLTKIHQSGDIQKNCDTSTMPQLSTIRTLKEFLQSTPKMRKVQRTTSYYSVQKDKRNYADMF